MALGKRALIIVGIGASVGGLDAFRRLFTAMPADTGLAFVLIQHLSAEGPSLLVDLLASCTSMPVYEGTNEMPIGADTIYVIPPNATMTVEHDMLKVARPSAQSRRHPVDALFVSLAEDRGERAVGVVLTGGGGDGSEGVRTLKEHGGLVLAQAEPGGHVVDGMPSSAVATGYVDELVTLDDLAPRLVQHLQHVRAATAHKGSDGTRGDVRAELASICALLRHALGHDFSEYKPTALVRRVQRRMQVLRVASASSYVERLREHPEELSALFQELLIEVTTFFRDPAVFSALSGVLEPLAERAGADQSIRAWVPACATGEEAYSVAILLRELLRERAVQPRLQIFASDINEQAITRARAGRYTRGQLVNVSPERLQRWFKKDGEHYVVKPEIRETCVFSPHNVTRDPPFSRIDLVSCRNLFIYLEPALQERLLRTFHYALRPGGYLVLGAAESISRQSALFAPVHGKLRILQRRDGPTVAPAVSLTSSELRTGRTRTSHTAAGPNVLDRHVRQAMERHLPAYLVVDRNHEVVRFYGAAERYLSPSSGVASLRVMKLLKNPLRTALHHLLSEVATTHLAGSHEGLVVSVDGTPHLIDLLVEPVPHEEASGAMVIVFRDRGPLGVPSSLAPGIAGAMDENCENELILIRERLQATIDMLETANQDLAASNEEFQATNEELQATNEELESSKEELQSMNEELQTLNGELSGKNTQLIEAYSNIRNLLDSTQIATLFLDEELRVKSFTPVLTELFHLRPSDRGRPITDIVCRLRYDELRSDAERTTRELVLTERELAVSDSEQTYLLRMRPYRRVDDVVDGLVLTFVDITDRKRQEQWRRALAAIVESTSDAIIGYDFQGNILSWNRGATTLFGYTAEEIVGRSVDSILPADSLVRHGVAPEEATLAAHQEVSARRKDGSPLELSLTSSVVRREDGGAASMSIIARDISERKENERRQDLLLDELNHRVKNTLALVQALAIETGATVDEPAAFREAFFGRLHALAHCHELLTRRHWDGAPLAEVLHTAAAPFERARSSLFEGHGPIIVLSPAAVLTLGIVFHELVTNAAKYGALSTTEGKIRVDWEVIDASPGPYVRLVWNEEGGPPVAAPTHSGLGSRLLNQSLNYQFRALTNVEYAPSGLCFSFEAPLSAIGTLAEVHYEE